MAEIEQHQQADGTYYIGAKNLLVETDIEQTIEALKSVYQPTQACYVILDLADNFVLPIRVLSSQIRLFHQEISSTNAPLFLALIIEPSLIQMIETVFTTLMRRDLIQPFIEMKRAKQWLTLERMKQQKVKDIGAAIRESEEVSDNK